MDDRLRDGIKAYTKVGLRVYDTVVMRWLAKSVWGCPADHLVQYYRQQITSNHAEIGVGTGYRLDRCGFDTPAPRLVLIDLQPNCLKISTGEVITFGRLDCDARRAWEKVCFYEHISRKPSWLLRTVLPTPQRTTGCYGAVGDESRCMYSDGGYLAKKIRRIIPGRQIDFDIIEQTIRYARRIVLRGGTIQIDSHADGTSSVRMLTRYELHFPTFWVGRLLVDFVVSAMHKVVIRDMQDRLRCFEAPETRKASA